VKWRGGSPLSGPAKEAHPYPDALLAPLYCLRLLGVPAVVEGCRQRRASDIIILLQRVQASTSKHFRDRAPAGKGRGGCWARVLRASIRVQVAHGRTPKKQV